MLMQTKNNKTVTHSCLCTLSQREREGVGGERYTFLLTYQTNKNKEQTCF